MKRSTTKRALLMSILSMFLCFTMLMGTTFAWFTDSVESGTNQIIAGNLDVELYHSDSAATDEKVSVSTKLFDDVDSTKWEPGAMAWEKFTVKNEGNLALKYQLTLNAENATVINGVSFASMLKVAVVDADFEYTRANVEAIKAEKWSDLATFTLPGTLEAKADGATEIPSAVHGIIIWWQPTDNDNLFNMNNGKTEGSVKVDVGVKLFATQMKAEMDSFGDDYDASAPAVTWDGTVKTPVADENGVYHITSGAELAGINNLLGTLLNEQSINVVLDTDIDLANLPWTPIGVSDSWGEVFSGTFNGNSHTIYNVNVGGTTAYDLRSTPANDVGFFGSTTNRSSIKNLTLENVVVNGGERVGALIGKALTTNITNCHVANATVTGIEKVGGLVGHFDSATISNCSVVKANVSGEGKVGGLAGRTISAYGDVTVMNNSVSNSVVTSKSDDLSGEFIGQDYYDNTAVIGNVEENVDVYSASEPNDTIVYIWNADDLYAFAAEVNAYSNYEHPFEGKLVLLMDDIDLDGAEWTPIGDYRFSANRFCGTFDGQGHTISNFQITKKTDKNDANKSSYGFFGNMEGTVKNLTIDNATVCSYAYVGALIGRLTAGTVENCHVTNSSVETTYWQAGGMIGQLNDGCTVKGCSITNTTVTGASAIGAMFGPLTAANEEGTDKLLFENCSVKDCAVVQKGSFGESYDKLFGAMFNDIDVADNETNINNCKVENTTVKGVASDALFGVLSGNKVYFDGFTFVSDGLYKNGVTYRVYNANGLETLNAMMADQSAGRDTVVNLMADIYFDGKTWTPVDSHADIKFELAEFNGNGHTIYNLTVNGQAMFTRFAGTGDVVIKDITFDGAKVDSTANGTITNNNIILNTSILTVQTYQNLLLDNVDVKNSNIMGGYKVAPLIASVYNENPNSSVTATLKNCDVSNTTVISTKYDFCTAGMVAFVNAGDNDNVEFENCTVSAVKIIAPDDDYDAHAWVYTTGSGSLFDEVPGVTVSGCTFENN